MNDRYQAVVDRIMKKLEEGVVPWRRPWKVAGGEWGGAPRNLITKKPYRGMNRLTLISYTYDSLWWLTEKQAAKLGGKIKEDEKPADVMFCKWSTQKDRNDKTGKRTVSVPFFCFFEVYNLEQTEGCRIPKGVVIEKKGKDEDAPIISPIQAAEEVIANCPNPPKVEFGGGYAVYRPLTDEVGMPKLEKFDSANHFYSVYFHEFAHASGHASRLNRKSLTKVETVLDLTKDYGYEELVAEFGAAFLCAETGIDNSALDDNAASYLDHWFKYIGENPEHLVMAAGQAQKAADFVLGRVEIKKKKAA